MNFKKATDELLESVTLEDLASALGVSLQAVRQARAREDTTAFRPSPEGWEEAVIRLARKQAARLSKLSTTLEKSNK